MKLLPVKSRTVVGVSLLAIFLTIVATLLILSPRHAERGNWGGMWGTAEEVKTEKLPAEVMETLQRIKSGGPFPYREDGMVFRNQARKLPIKRRGYYRIYVVPTPGVEGSGQRRIIAGAGKARDYAHSDEYWYTPDNYETLQRIRESGQ